MSENLQRVEAWRSLLGQIREGAAQLEQGGGAKAIERQHKKQRLTARERISSLLDEGTSLFEVGLWAAWGMYQEWGGAPSAGVVCGIGRVSGRDVMIIANDATIKAGAFFPMTCKKVLRAQRIAMQNRLPLVYLVDSAGVFLPLQDEIFPDEDDFGRIFRNNSVISAMGIPQLAAIMGNCVAGGGYLPVLCDKLVMTEGSGLYLAGPALVKSAIGQEVSHEELGGAEMHAAISGTIDFREPDDPSCLRRLRDLCATLPTNHLFHPASQALSTGESPPDAASAPSASPSSGGPFRRETERPPARPEAEIYEAVSVNPQERYDFRDVLAHVIDADSFLEYKPEYGKTIVCGYASIGGFKVGIVANSRRVEQTPKEGMQFGGVIYHDSADKAARFIMDCNQNWLPLIFFHDVMGFMVGRDSEQAGIIRAGAKLVNVISNSRVPKLSIIVGGSYGAGNYAMCGKAFDPRLIFAWPTARYAVMGAKQAASTVYDVSVAALKRAGQVPDAEELEALRETVAKAYEDSTDSRYAASRGWVDGIIDPQDTRNVLIRSLELVTRHAEPEPFRTGVLQV